MQVLNTFLTILLFVVCLSTLIMIHEAGHLATAKMFGVYCDDYSIGFGPAIFHKKKKNWETYFSIRAIPFGGFVSMASDEGEMPSGVHVPKERSLKGIKRWKAAIIMLAGIIMNVLLSIILLFVFNVAFKAKGLYSDVVSIESGSKAETAQIVPYNPNTKEGDVFLVAGDARYTTSGSQVLYYDFDAVATFENGDEVSVLAAIHEEEVTFKNNSFDNLLHYYTHFEEDEAKYNSYCANFSDEIKPSSVRNDSSLKSITLSFLTVHYEEGKYFCVSSEHFGNIEEDEFIEYQGHYYLLTDVDHENPISIMVNYTESTYVQDIVLSVVSMDGEKTFEKIGMSLYYLEKWLPFSKRVQNTFKQFGSSASLIFKTIGELFIGKGFNNVGSIVSAYSQQNIVINELGAEYLIYFWGLISINLAIVNLLPFPGLDGWQLLVLAVEGSVNAVRRAKLKKKTEPKVEEKEDTEWRIPDKVKGIVSMVGIGLLFAFMVLLVIKDVIGLF